MLVFAVLGGGYYVYNTFASTVAQIVYSQSIFNSTTNNTSHTIYGVNSDGSELTSIQASGWTSSPTSASGVVASRGRYSPNHTYVAWTTSPNPNPSQTGTVHVRNLSSVGSKSQATRSFSMPSGESDGNVAVPLTWYPDNNQLLLNTWNASNNKLSLWVLDTSTGKFTLKLQLPYVDSWAGVKSMVVLGNNKSVVFTDNDGVKFLSANSTSPRLVNAGSQLKSCGKVRAKPGTPQEFVYKCFDQSLGANAIYRQTPLTQPVKIYSEPVTGGTYSNLFDFALSPDGTQAAAYLIDSTVLNATTCEYSVSSRIVAFDYSGAGFEDHGAISPAVTQTGCKGGGDSEDINRLVYAPDGKSFAYLKMNGWLLGDQKLATLVPAKYSSTGSAVLEVLADDVYDISW